MLKVQGPRTEGIHIKQTMTAHTTSNMYHFHALIMCGWVNTKSLKPYAYFPEVHLHILKLVKVRLWVYDALKNEIITKKCENRLITII